MTKAAITKPAKKLTGAISEQSRARRRALKAAVGLDAVAGLPRRNDILADLKIEQRPIATLRYPARLLRQVTPEHVAEIAQSIAKFGVVDPVLVSTHDRIINGVSVVEAARSLGLESIPCVVVDHLSPDEMRLLRLALNRLGEKGTWHLGELKLEFGELLDASLSLIDTGFMLPEIDLVLATDEPIIDKTANECPDVDTDLPSVSRVGDMWVLGQHRVLCGDSTKVESYARLFRDLPAARSVFTDPPYNICIDGFAAGKGKHNEFVAASGEMSDEEFVTFLTEFMAGASAHLVDGGIMFCCMDWRHGEHVHRAARGAGLSLLNVVVWSKGVGGLGGLYRSAHEFVFVLKKGTAPTLNNVELGKHGRDRTNVWVYPGANQKGSSANAELGNHPTPKPVELVADALLDVTERGDVVVDPFLGSGTTIIAAERTGRTAAGLELDPHYVDLIVRRFQNYTGVAAVHAETGKTFDEMMGERSTSTPTSMTYVSPETAATRATAVDECSTSPMSPGASTTESAIQSSAISGEDVYVD